MLTMNRSLTQSVARAIKGLAERLSDGGALLTWIFVAFFIGRSSCCQKGGAKKTASQLNQHGNSSTYVVNSQPTAVDEL